MITMTNPLESRKFVYALSMLVTSVIITLLPSVVSLDQAATAQLYDMITGVFVVGLTVIAGHTLQDALTAVSQVNIEDITLTEAVIGLIEALTEPEDETE